MFISIIFNLRARSSDWIWCVCVFVCVHLSAYVLTRMQLKLVTCKRQLCVFSPNRRLASPRFSRCYRRRRRWFREMCTVFVASLTPPQQFAPTQKPVDTDDGRQVI